MVQSLTLTLLSASEQNGMSQQYFSYEGHLFDQGSIDANAFRWLTSGLSACQTVNFTWARSSKNRTGTVASSLTYITYACDQVHQTVSAPTSISCKVLYIRGSWDSRETMPESMRPEESMTSHGVMHNVPSSWAWTLLQGVSRT